METDVRKLEQMIIEANNLQAKYDNCEKIDMSCEEYGTTKPTQTKLNNMTKLVFETALKEDIAIALSCTRWRRQFHLSDIEFFRRYGIYFLKDIKDPFDLIEFTHAAMITMSKPMIVKNCREGFSKLGLSFYKENFIEVFDDEKPDKKCDNLDLLLQLVEKIYNYFTKPYTEENNKLKYELLHLCELHDDIDLEDTMCDLREVYDFKINEDIYYLVQVVYNNEESLSDIEGLTAENDWKHIILSHYNFETITYPLFENCYPEIIAIHPEYKNLFDEDEILFNLLDPELCKFEIDLFDMEKLREECKRDLAKRLQQEKSSKGGKKSKKNHSKAITIKNKITGKEICFNSAEECAKYLNVSKRGMVNFKQGTTKLNRTWEILS